METTTQGSSTAGTFVPQSSIPVRYCLYARKSTEQDELQALSIESQIKEMTEAATREGLEIAEIRREAHSAKESGQRPVFQQLVADVRSGKFTGIIAWDPSRISRNAGDLGSIVDLMDSKRLVDIRTHGQRFTNSPNDKFMLMILCSQAKLENDHKGENVKRGLRAKCERGFRPGVSPIGYIHDKYADKGQKRIMLDPERAPIIKQMFEKVAYEDASGRDIHAWMVDIGFTTRSGKRVAVSGIYRMLKDTFYYGEFEYPVGSGKFYQSSVDPIITKELYLKAQANLQAPPRRHPGTCEFDFTRLFYCGSCGSGITAEEKFKNLKGGGRNRYVYYHCTRFKDKHCKEKPIREENLVSQLLHIIDKVDIDEIGAREQIEREVTRYRQLAYGVLGQELELDRKPYEADVRRYTKHILVHGSKDEKREILGCIKSRIELRGKSLVLRIGSPIEK
jgi:DNA invertase Pin-like site-specific DNA recombinase